MSCLGIETYYPPPRVDFDPDNPEHLIALALLQFHGRQHPTIRFKIDPTKYGNVPTALVDLYLKHRLPKDIQESASSYADSHKHLVVGTIIEGAVGDCVKLKLEIDRDC